MISIKNLILVVLAILGNSYISTGQMERINSVVTQKDAEAHLRFLASDELRGRNTGSQELNIAARYISEQFRRSGLQPLGDMEGEYLQRVPIITSTLPTQAKATVLDKEFNYNIDLAFINGINGLYTGDVVYLNEIANYKDQDIKDKIVVTVLRDLRASIGNMERIQLIKDAGAIGLVEIFGPGHQFPWRLVVQYLHGEKMKLGEAFGDTALPHVWVRDSANVLIQQFNNDNSGSATITLDGISRNNVETYNVVGRIEGTDTILNKEHLIMCAHYDHVGVQSGKGIDSIYNGTRDNAIGTTGIINAARYLGKFPPKRSVIILALTGEEKGLLGSQYYTNHPQIPLEQSVFALNIDNSGYTDTEVITLLDTARTNIDELVYQAASEVGLGVIGDRIPSQNYYERSDQVSFATKGVPAINFKMSMTAFDERISKFYHEPSDEIETVDLNYIYKYWRAYIRTAELIGNWDKRPYWIKGDKFESAGNTLYKR